MASSEAFEGIWHVKFRRTQYPHHKNQHVPEKSGITFPMQSTHANVNSISDLATGNGNDATPFSQQSVVLTKRAYIELKWQAKYWRAQHEQSLKREAALKAQVEALEATGPRPQPAFVRHQEREVRRS